MERIVFLDRSTLVAKLRRPGFAHEWREYEQTAPAEIVARLRDATIAIVNKVPLRGETLRELPQLKLIAVAATGMDNIDLAVARERRITVVNVRGYARRTVPEHVLMLILALRRSLLRYRADMQRGAWQQASQFCLLTHPVRDLEGATLGIIGYGSIGRGVEKLAQAVGLKTLVAERRGRAEIRPGRTKFETVLRASDIITLHTPLNEETRNLIGAAELEMMRPAALLINCARGGIANEEALADALRRGLIAGAGIDVLSSEPPVEGNPLLELDLPNLIVTPHVAWASDAAMQALADQLIDNIEKAVTSER